MEEVRNTRKQRLKAKQLTSRKEREAVGNNGLFFLGLRHLENRPYSPVGISLLVRSLRIMAGTGKEPSMPKMDPKNPSRAAF